MARRKKKGVLHYTGQGIKYTAKGTWFLAKQGYRGVKYIVDKSKQKHEEGQEQKKEARRPQVEASYSSFQQVHQFHGDLEQFEEKILDTHKSLIGIIIGGRGTGKSAIAMRILENVRAKSERNVCALGFKKEHLPSWITVVDTIESIPNGSFVVIDEAGIEFGSRESMSNVNKLLSSLLFVARHKDLSILFLSQSSSNIEINVIRQADYLILKHSSLLQLDFERKKIQDIYQEVQSYFEKYSDNRGLAYIYSHDFRGFISNSLPSFWNANVSKSYAGKDLKKDEK